MNRRRFFQRSAAACAALGVAPSVRALDIPAGMNRRDLPKPRADAIIFLWLPGGLGQTDFFDPKKYTPFVADMRSMDMLGTCESIPTNVDGIRFGAGLEKMASVMDKGTLVRTLATPARRTLHANEQFRMMTGYQFPTAFKPPSLGAIVSRTLGPRAPSVPANIHLARSSRDGFAQTSKNADFVNAIHGSGFYGIDHAPFHVLEPGAGIKTLYAASGMSKERIDDRLALLKAMTRYADAPIINSPQSEDYMKVLDSAREMMDSSARDAFDISQEPYSVLKAYHADNRFGQGCLVARRLIEAGARYVQVDYPFQPFNFIDAHGIGYKRNAMTKKNIDSPIAQLIFDLEARGLLDRTIVAVMTEFGRTVSADNGQGKAKQGNKMATLKMYGFHGHFSQASCALFYGGGFKRGFAFGKTRDEHPMVPLGDGIGVSDIHATILTALGVAPDVYYLTDEDRPVFVTNLGKGRQVTALYA